MSGETHSLLQLLHCCLAAEHAMALNGVLPCGHSSKPELASLALCRGECGKSRSCNWTQTSSRGLGKLGKAYALAGAVAGAALLAASFRRRS